MAKKGKSFLLRVLNKLRLIFPLRLSRLRILFYTDYCIDPKMSSSMNRNYHIIRILSEIGCQIHYCYNVKMGTKSSEIMSLEKKYTNFRTMDYPPWKSNDGMEYDIFWISELFDIKRMKTAAKAISYLRKDSCAAILSDTIDFHLGSLKSINSLEKSNAKNIILEAETREAEENIYRISDLITCVTRRDEQAILKEYGLKRKLVSIIPNIHVPKEKKFLDYDKNAICYIASKGNRHNILALKFLLEDVMLKVLKESPNVRLNIIGLSKDAEGMNEIETDEVVARSVWDSTSVLGRVDDINEEISRHALSVAPMLSGYGVKGKILSSLESGVPAITTIEGSLGLEEGFENSVFVTSKDTLAEYLVELLNNSKRRDEMSREGLRYIRDNYSEENARIKIIKALNIAYRKKHC